MMFSVSSFMLTLCIWREARSEGPDGMKAVYDVIQNRQSDDRWPNDVLSVTLQPKQFSCFNMGDGQSIVFPQPKNVGDWLAWLQAERIVGANTRPSMDANHYHSLPDGKHPKWAKGRTPIKSIGKLKFYRW